MIFVRQLFVAAVLVAGGADAGDRHVPAHRQIPARAFWHEGKGGNWVDVTKPPFCAKGDGKTDDTAALCAALRWVRDQWKVPCSRTGAITCDHAKTNINIGNMLENVTVDTGRGNPGAIGVAWNSSNCGGIRALRYDIDLDPETLDSSDHSPVIVDFTF